MLSSWCSQWSRLLLVIVMAASATGCVTTSERVGPSQSTSQEKPSGFFDRMLDNLSERECNVRRFTCPYGVGSAGEPCECVGPDNVVYQGRTVK